MIQNTIRGTPPLNKATGKYRTLIKTMGHAADEDDDSYRICIEGTGKAYRVADIRMMSGTIGSVPGLVGVVQIPNWYPDATGGVPSALYKPTSTIQFNGPVSSTVIAMYVQSESAPNAPYIFIDDWPIYDTDIWLYVHSTQTGEELIVSVTLEEVELTEIGKLASLNRIADLQATRFSRQNYVEPS